ncbi:DUF2061 domain-containing protein [Caldichromatium japonicum]|uniref:DUF2061 domain-containing protein n=1 Tax=Caldichromatium japonicum TaxID=2699430 RepID=A0A6G7VBT8_9GAMM|nr:DUF2061 domain-containing protein [Caldichromatium japonicum]QIK37370.1 DUF2061 domain-containing protein [Caldichromatium japonicum]
MIKTLTFGIVHISVAFGVGYLMTGSIVIGGALALVEPVVNTIAYFLHEKTWEWLRASRRPSQTLATFAV